MGPPSAYMGVSPQTFVHSIKFAFCQGRKRFRTKGLSAVRLLSSAQRTLGSIRLLDLMWSDPDEVESWAVSPRGAGWLFGRNIAQEVRLTPLSQSPLLTLQYQFNHVNKLSVIARAHQLVQEGYKYMFDEQLVTVWSAPNYCYRCGNMAAIMTVHEDGSRTFTVYDAAPENDRDKGQGRRLVSGPPCYKGFLLMRYSQNNMPYFV